MDKSKKDAIKAKAAAVKAKAKGIKAKVKGNVKGKCAVAIVSAAFCAFALGCMDTNPASRQNASTHGDTEPTVKVVIGEHSISNTVIVTQKVTLGDGVVASADSSGSTETQTATPTLDIRTKIDARYNDALAAASNTSMGVLESLTTAGANKVLSLMADKTTGIVEVQKTDGSMATVKCENGQCSFCTDGSCTDGECKDGNCSK